MPEPRRWRKHFRCGRWQFSVTLMNHVYPLGPDRWVLQTSTVYDRREARSEASGSQ
jgi:hypothetical protein